MAQTAKSQPTAWFDQASNLMQSWGEQHQNLFRTWAENFKGQADPATSASAPTGGMGNAVEMAQAQFGQMAELFKKSMEGWAALAQAPADAKGGLDASVLKKLFDPAEWGRAGNGGFDLALEHLTEGPSYATLWDLDRKLLKAQRLSQARMQDIAAYQMIVQAAWNTAFEKFVKALGDSKGEPLQSARDFLDLWIATANDVLLEMHRTPKFLEAQRKVTRSSAEYRLQEREIAEVFCEMHHIPTRTEMDEVQRTVVELRRELRALKSGAGPRVVAKSAPAAVSAGAKRARAASKRTKPAARSKKGIHR